jgi:hypothetical protein
MRPHPSRRRTRGVFAMNRHYPAIRLLADWLLYVRVASVIVLGTLVLAASAQAAGQATESAPEGTSPAPTTESPPPVETVTESASENPPPVETVTEPPPVTETSTESSPPVEAVTEPTLESAPPVETVTELIPEPPPPVETVTELIPEPPPPVETVTEPVRPVEALKEATADPIQLAPEAPPPITPIQEQSKEASSSQQPAVEGVEGSPPPATPQDAAVLAPATSVAAAPDASTLGDSLATGATTSEPGVPAVKSTSPVRAIGAAARLSEAQRAADLNCELSGLSGPATDDCTAGWLAGQSLSSTSPAYLTTAALTARAATSAGGENGGAMGASRSVTPPPGPAPSGAFGSSAAGGCGTAPAGFFTLSGHLRLVAPRAMRRLKLSCQPWRTAFFVLIPERPG